MSRIKTLGNIALVAITMWSAQVLAMQVRMTLADEEGKTPLQLAIGQPYMLEVAVTNASTSAQVPQIEGLDVFEVRRVGTNMSVINGNATMKYTYRIRADKPGTYRVGPARVVDHNDTAVSSKLTIKVGTSQVNDTSKQAKNVPQDNKRALVKLSVDKAQAVVGEKITCTVRFYYYGDAVTLQTIRVPEFEGFVASEKKGPFAGKQVMDGVQYSFIEWRWDLFAQEPGQKNIQVVAADYVQQPDEEDFFAGFMSMFRAMQDRKRVYSNPLKITVDPLPATDKQVQAVGDFRSFTAIVDTPTLKEGDGSILLFELEGDGNIDAVKELDIQHVPPMLKWFSSKSYLVPNGHGGAPTKKRFEFVLQGVQAGECVIPAQEFTYYDIVSKKYKTLTSQPIALTITPLSNKKQEASPVTSPEILENNKDKKTADVDELMPLVADFSDGRADRSMPWMLFFMLLLFPLLYGAWLWLHAWWIEYAQQKKHAMRDRNAFIKARSQLQQCCKAQQPEKIYGIFSTLFADRYKISADLLTEQRMEEILIERNFSPADVAAWQDFLHQLSAVSFAGKKTSVVDLEKQATAWLARLQEKL